MSKRDLLEKELSLPFVTNYTIKEQNGVLHANVNVEGPESRARELESQNLEVLDVLTTFEDTTARVCLK